MEFKTIIIECIKYIEKNINESIAAEDTANNAGYSLYYFSRIFKKQMGLSIMEYVKERRLIRASEEIENGKKIIDVAIDYGYQSHSGFTKAFKNHFGFSPVLLRVFSFQINIIGGNCNMSHVFIKNPAIHAVKEELYKLLATTINENMLKYNQERIRKAYDRLHNMRTIMFMDETGWKEKAKETFDIFSPIAAKLNNKKVMAELNDLSVKYI